jgi:hypothetical protein
MYDQIKLNPFSNYNHQANLVDLEAYWLSSLSDTSAVTKTNIAKNQLEAEVNTCNVVLMNNWKVAKHLGKV